MDIALRLERVRAAVAEAEAAAGRIGAVTIVAVSKTFPPAAIRAAYAAGQRAFGENRVQEGVAKIAELAVEMPDASWHLIGTLQSNKARPAVQAFSLIESVDRLPLAQRVDRAAEMTGKIMPILLEINVAGEASKAGFPLEGFWEALPQLLSLRHLELAGLMTVAPNINEPETVRPVFGRLRDLRDEANERYQLTGFTQLSMGMSNDFRVAIAEGATIVRLGRAIFGERPVGEEV